MSNDTWNLLRLGEIAEINPKRSSLISGTEDTELVTFLPMPSINQFSGTIEMPESRSFSEVKKGFTYFEENDVLFAKITPCMENGKSAIARSLSCGFGFGSTEFHVIRGFPNKVLPEWIHYFVRQGTIRKLCKRNFRGAVGQQRVPKDFLSNINIPIPSSLDEQRRIVAKIKECMSRIDEIEKLRHDSIEMLEKFDESLIEDFWSRDEICTAPKMAISAVAQTSTGNTPSRKREDFFNGDTPWVTPGDFVSRVLASHKQTLSAKGISEGKARTVEAGSCMVVCIGATIGKVSLALTETGFNQQINSATFDKEKVLPEFGYWACRALKKEIIKNASQSTLPILNKGRFSKLKIPVPSLDVQNKISSVMNSAHDKAVQAMTVSTASDEILLFLRDSILRKAFAGEL